MDTSAVRITVEANGYELVIEGDQLEDFSLSIPSDVYGYPGNQNELGHTHIALTGLFKEGVRPEWRETSG